MFIYSSNLVLLHQVRRVKTKAHDIRREFLSWELYQKSRPSILGLKAVYYETSKYH